jgi:hypothetical protein
MTEVAYVAYQNHIHGLIRACPTLPIALGAGTGIHMSTQIIPYVTRSFALGTALQEPFLKQHCLEAVKVAM